LKSVKSLKLTKNPPKNMKVVKNQNYYPTESRKYKYWYSKSKTVSKYINIGESIGIEILLLKMKWTKKKPKIQIVTKRK